MKYFGKSGDVRFDLDIVSDQFIDHKWYVIEGYICSWCFLRFRDETDIVYHLSA